MSASTAPAIPIVSRATQIPLEARIISVCDAYHAMTSERPYRAPVGHMPRRWTSCAACAGSQFDPAVVEAFVRTLAQAADAEPRLEPMQSGDPAATAGAAVR